jgi:hypothetical protein
MASLYNADLKPLSKGTYTHPYNHATKLFVADTYRLAPKQSFLYYVVINVDPSQTQLGSGFLGGVLSFADRFQNLESGMLVKRVELPKFSIATKTLNAYNRKNTIQTNITYDPISISFHDDSADVITNFWNDYYTYYYRDSDYNADDYSRPEKYAPRSKIGWGFSPRNSSLPNFIKNIRIFSLHNKRFTEYLLVNPVITAWRHGEHDSSNDRSLMENTMTVSYETVKYYTGLVNPVSVDGFSLLHYDNTPSPISTSVTNIYTDAGILGVLDSVPKDLRKPDGSDGAGGPLSSLLSMFRLYNNLKNVNLKTVVGTSLGQIGVGVLNNTINNGLNYAFPTLGGGVAGINGSGVAGAGINAASYPYGSSIPNFGATIAGAAAGSIAGVAVNTLNQSLELVGSEINKGINNGVNAIFPPTPGSNAVYTAYDNNGQIRVNSSSLQPGTGTTTALYLDSQGNPIARVQVSGTQSGSYNPNNLSENLIYAQTVTDPSGQEIIKNVYKDGTQVNYDAVTGNTLQIIPGSNTQTVLGLPNSTVNTNPMNAAQAASAGIVAPANSVQYRTDPNTGLVYTVGNSTSALFTNTLAGATGAGVGLYAGISLNSALNNTGLGRTVIGQVVSGAISTAAGAAIGRAVNNGLQPIINKVTGGITQGFDDVTGKIRNVVGSVTGTGGYDPNKPLDNIVSTTYDPGGGTTTVFRNGDVLYEDPNGNRSLTPAPGNSSLTNFFNSSPGQNNDPSAVNPYYGTIWTDGSGQPIYTGTGEYLYAGDPTLQPKALQPGEWEAMNEGVQSSIQNLDMSNVGPGPTDLEIQEFNASLGDFPG